MTGLPVTITLYHVVFCRDHPIASHHQFGSRKRSISQIPVVHPIGKDNQVVVDVELRFFSQISARRNQSTTQGGSCHRVVLKIDDSVTPLAGVGVVHGEQRLDIGHVIERVVAEVQFNGQMAEVDDGPVVTAGVGGVVHQAVAHFEIIYVTATCEYNRVIASRIFDVVRFDTTKHTTHALSNLAVTED